MTHEPWKRAAQLSKVKRLGKNGGQGRPAPRIVRRTSWGTIIVLLLLIVLIGGFIAAWLMRGWWVPRYKDKLPGAVAGHVEEPRVYVDYRLLEEGLGADLKLFGDYLDLISTTRDWRDDWKVTQTGPDTLRLENTGIKVYVKDGVIDTYLVDVKVLFEDKKWGPWVKHWRDANLTPDLTWTAWSGSDSDAPGIVEEQYESSASIRRGDGWVHPVYVLTFRGNWLRRVEGRYNFGPAADELPDGVE